MGSLEDHLATCDFTLLPCPYLCKNDGEILQLMRKDLDEHKKEQCPRRPHECPHCKESGEYKEMTTTHLEECPMVEVPCPKRMCLQRMPRSDVSQHLQECPFEEIYCKYANIGCKEKVFRKNVSDLQVHMEDSLCHLQLAIDAVHRHEIAIERHDDRLQGLSNITDKRKYSKASDIKLRWRMGEPAPVEMSRCCNAVVGESVVYFNAACSREMYSYDVNSKVWTRLPDCPYVFSSFAVVDNVLLSIGGELHGERTNKLFSLKQDTEPAQWVEELPSMPTKRSEAASICTNTALIVAGGRDAVEVLVVEVLDIETRQWSVAASLPERLFGSGVIIEDSLYIGNNWVYGCCYSCSLSDLLRSCQPVSQSNTSGTATSVWSKLADLPEPRATCVSLCGHLLAIGGGTYTFRPSKSVYIYKSATNTWEKISEMLEPRSECFAVTLPTNTVMVVGGRNRDHYTNTVQFAEVI